MSEKDVCICSEILVSFRRNVIKVFGHPANDFIRETVGGGSFSRIPPRNLHFNLN